MAIDCSNPFQPIGFGHSVIAVPDLLSQKQ
jgi:hypothetical protein